MRKFNIRNKLNLLFLILLVGCATQLNPIDCSKCKLWKQETVMQAYYTGCTRSLTGYIQALQKEPNSIIIHKYCHIRTVAEFQEESK